MMLEPLAPAIVEMLERALGPIIARIVNLNEVDITRGAGVISPNEKCIWTKDGKRITITITSGQGVIASCSNLPDPNAPAAGTMQ